MTSAPLRVEIQLVASPLQAVCAHTALSTTTPMQLTNVEYVAQMIEISDSAVGIISSSMQGRPLEFVFPDYKNFQSSASLPTGATSVSVPIPAKYSSLKALFIAQRDSAKAGTITNFPYSCNVFSLRDYTFRIGPQVVPSKAPETVPEFFAEAVKAIGSMSNLTHQPSIDMESFSQDVPAANDDTATANGLVHSGSFFVGIDLENYPNADKSSLFSGWNSNTDDIYFNANYNGTGTATTVRYDTFATFDAVLKFENGTAYVNF
jgi:hypothetical protein